jgi:hypothetical protein
MPAVRGARCRGRASKPNHRMHGCQTMAPTRTNHRHRVSPLSPRAAGYRAHTAPWNSFILTAARRFVQLPIGTPFVRCPNWKALASLLHSGMASRTASVAMSELNRVPLK